MTRKNQNWIFACTRVAIPVLVFALVLLVASDAFACPTCKDGLAENDPASAAQAKGYFYSILFMMAMPFLILGTFGSAAYLSIRRAREQQSNESASLPEGSTVG